MFLPGGEIAVTSPETEHLVTVYDLEGKMVRDYGDREEIADRADINTQVNFGHLVADEMGNNYFSFDYLPEPTVRKFDRVGYLAMEISLKTLEFRACRAGGPQGHRALGRDRKRDPLPAPHHQRRGRGPPRPRSCGLPSARS